jgi:hypothetical protein
MTGSSGHQYAGNSRLISGVAEYWVIRLRG